MSSFSLFGQPQQQTPINDARPLRIAFLGAAGVGKTSLISKLTLGKHSETYYPTHKTNPILFNFYPQSFASRAILDDSEGDTLGYFVTRDDVVLSPVIYSAYSKLGKQPRKHESDVVKSKNDYYATYCYKNDRTNEYVPPHISPVLVELIDNPPFDPDQTVPFLEASLYIQLDKHILRNLANEPRRPVSTKPLLVASGASELNGDIDGYFLVYSSIPSSDPPPYLDAVKAEPDASASTRSPISVLQVIKDALSDAWREYYTFKTRWEQGKEKDVFSFKSALKNMWNQSNKIDMELMRAQLRKDIYSLDYSNDPADLNSPPPVWIVCTNTTSPLKSPILVEQGRKLASQWHCGFMETSIEDVELLLALMVREIVEKRKLQKRKEGRR